MKNRLPILILFILTCAARMGAQVTVTYTSEDQWNIYDAFNNALLDKTKNIYKADTKQPSADHRGNGFRDNDVSGCAAAIWCQAIYYDMVINAYNRARLEGDNTRMTKYKTLHNRMYNGMYAHYVRFNFDDPNTNNGWFVYDDIMWWTCALARAYETFGTVAYRNYSEKSFCRVWYGSEKVGDDGSYADPARFPGSYTATVNGVQTQVPYGGGMFWEWQPIAKANPHKPGDFRSACINFPTVIAACTLYKIVPEGRTAPTAARPTQQTKEWYLEKAKEVYAWADKYLVTTAGCVNDGIHGGNPGGAAHLYNQATYIGASVLLYQLTGEISYLTKARRGADYVINNMCKNGGYLNFETGYEQGVYAAIYAQYLRQLVYECGLSEALTRKYLNHITRNMQKGFLGMDQTRMIHSGNFAKATTATDVVESYGGSALPALMLMFPAGDTATPLSEAQEKKYDGPSDVYTPEGRLVMRDATPEQVHELDSGLYIFQRKKILVK